MEYAVIINDRSYELAKKTLSVMNKLDEVLRVDSKKELSVRQKYEKLYEFMKCVAGKEECKEMFGSDKLEEIDLSELTIAVRKVVDAYDKPVMEYEMEKTVGKLEQMPMAQLNSIAKTMQSVANVEMLNKK